MFKFTDFIRKRWSEISAASGQKGTVVDNLSVIPTGVVMSEFYNILVKQNLINNILNWKEMTDEQLDAFGSKFYIPRRKGNTAFGSIRIWFNERKDIVVSEKFRAVANNGRRYLAAQPSIVPGSSFLPSAERFALYYVDIPIVAESSGNVFNVIAGEITQLIDIDFTYETVSNQEAIISSNYTETNEDYYNRLIYSINDRSMSDLRSMYVRLPEIFPSVNAIYVAGAGDQYMTRDLVLATDLSLGEMSATYLGKIAGDNLIKHYAYYGIYPPEAGTVQADDLYNNSGERSTGGPLSIVSDFDYPLTIEATSLLSKDPAYRGYPLSQEASNAMYRGLYFDDYKTIMEHSTKPLFDIASLSLLGNVITPGGDWSYGASGHKNGDIGKLDDGLGAIDIIKFSGNNIYLKGGADNTVSVGLDIKKRIGVKVSGAFRVPYAENDDVVENDIQIMVGGASSDHTDAFTGIGFGIKMLSKYIHPTSPDVGNGLTYNAVAYIAHSEKYGSAQIFAGDDDISGVDQYISTTGINALAETQMLLRGSNFYDFEFIIHDDLQVTLYLHWRDNEFSPGSPAGINDIYIKIPSKVLRMFSQELYSNNTTHYGTDLKLTLNSNSIHNRDEWSIYDLKAVDMSKHSANVLYSINTKNITAPAKLKLRAAGQSSISGRLAPGYIVYIWDNEAVTVGTGQTPLSQGGWVELDGVSDSDGSKSSLGGLLTHDLLSLERYTVKSRFGKSVFVMIKTTKTSEPQYKYANRSIDDIESSIQVDYIELEGFDNKAFHTYNKADVYTTTYNNSETQATELVTLTKLNSESYFELSVENGIIMPISEIRSISINVGGVSEETLTDGDYKISYVNKNMFGSSKDVWRLSLVGRDSNTVTISYSTYRSIADMQNYFDNTQYKKIYGDMLIKHPYPCDLNFGLQYSGDINDEQLIEEIRKYVDLNITGTFSVDSLVRYLYENKFANNVKEPIEVTYRRINDNFEYETGAFTNSLTVRPIDFFKLGNITVNKI